MNKHVFKGFVIAILLQTIAWIVVGVVQDNTDKGNSPAKHVIRSVKEVFYDQYTVDVRRTKMTYEPLYNEWKDRGSMFYDERRAKWVYNVVAFKGGDMVFSKATPDSSKVDNIISEFLFTEWEHSLINDRDSMEYIIMMK